MEQEEPERRTLMVRTVLIAIKTVVQDLVENRLEKPESLLQRIRKKKFLQQQQKTSQNIAPFVLGFISKQI